MMDRFGLTLLAMLFFGILPIKLHTQDLHVNNLLNTVSDRSYLQLMRGNIPSRNVNAVVERATFMEAQIAPSFFIRFKEEGKFTLSITPKIILRMGDNESFPIKAPSFMPIITGFQQLKADKLSTSKALKWLLKPQHRVFVIYRIGHHSNGQKDEFFVKGTRRINFSTGNFSTEFVELGLQWTDMTGGANGFSINGRLSFEQQIDLTREADIKELYYDRRLLLENEFNFTPYLQLATKVDFMMGQGSRFEPKSSFQVSGEFKPARNYSDLSLFIRYYLGPDYYNIRYFSDQDFIGFGIRANPSGKNALAF